MFYKTSNIITLRFSSNSPHSTRSSTYKNPGNLYSLPTSENLILTLTFTYNSKCISYIIPHPLSTYLIIYPITHNLYSLPTVFKTPTHVIPELHFFMILRYNYTLNFGTHELPLHSIAFTPELNHNTVPRILHQKCSIFPKSFSHVILFHRYDLLHTRKLPHSSSLFV